MWLSYCKWYFIENDRSNVYLQNAQMYIIGEVILTLHIYLFECACEMYMDIYLYRYIRNFDKDWCLYIISISTLLQLQNGCLIKWRNYARPSRFVFNKRNAKNKWFKMKNGILNPLFRDECYTERNWLDNFIKLWKMKYWIDKLN